MNLLASPDCYRGHSTEMVENSVPNTLTQWCLWTLLEKCNHCQPVTTKQESEQGDIYLNFTLFLPYNIWVSTMG